MYHIPRSFQFHSMALGRTEIERNFESLCSPIGGERWTPLQYPLHLRESRRHIIVIEIVVRCWTIASTPACGLLFLSLDRGL